MAICGDRLWRLTNHRNGLLEELFGRIRISFLAEPRIKQIAVLLKRSIEIPPFSMDLQIRLVTLPGFPCVSISFRS